VEQVSFAALKDARADTDQHTILTRGNIGEEPPPELHPLNLRFSLNLKKRSTGRLSSGDRLDQSCSAILPGAAAGSLCTSLGLSCCFASGRTLHPDGHHQRMSVPGVAPPRNDHKSLQRQNVAVTYFWTAI
jgi:hypothetical protein